MVVVGDLQGTHQVESLVLRREDNRRETEALVCQMGGEGQGATALLGDLVTWGSSEDSWRHFDELASRIQGTLLPVRGNHDYLGLNEEAREQWLRRFPWFEQASWYSVKWNRLGLVFLESNLGELPVAAQTAQRHWYERVLAEFEQDPLVSGILVFLHHAPYTNNPNAQGGLDDLRKAFVAPFCRSTKVLAMVAGHAHGYERFAKPCGDRESLFIVSGGGGGPRPVESTCFDDECLASGCCESSSRPLHYLVLQQRPKGLEVTVQAQRTKTADGVLEVVQIPFRDQSEFAPVTSSCSGRSARQVTECPWQAPE